jgi:hypothetical protein
MRDLPTGKPMSDTITVFATPEGYKVHIGRGCGGARQDDLHPMRVTREQWLQVMESGRYCRRCWPNGITTQTFDAMHAFQASLRRH